jgi:hypothetical protein
VKYTDEDLAEYISLTEQIKQMEKRKDELKAAILAAPRNTVNHTVSVVESERIQIEGHKAILDKSQKLYDALMTAGCIYKVPVKRLVVTRK